MIVFEITATESTDNDPNPPDDSTLHPDDGTG